MGISNQEKIWDAISAYWKTFRVVPVKEAISFIKGCKGNVLDIGCGSGRNFFGIPGKLYGVDFSKNQLKYAKEYADKNNIDVILKKSGAEKLPFPNNFFDKIICIATIHCIDSDKKRKESLNEIFRVLHSGGKALITVWDKDQEKFKKGPKEIMLPWNINNKKYSRYYYLYNKKEISGLLKEIGFKIIKILDKKTKDSLYSKRNILLYVKKP